MLEYRDRQIFVEFAVLSETWKHVFVYLILQLDLEFYYREDEDEEERKGKKSNNSPTSLYPNFSRSNQMYCDFVL